MTRDEDLGWINAIQIKILFGHGHAFLISDGRTLLKEEQEDSDKILGTHWKFDVLLSVALVIVQIINVLMAESQKIKHALYLCLLECHAKRGISFLFKNIRKDMF